MHFSISDTAELKEPNGSNYIGYNIHINGAFHCTVRYKQLHSLHEQLKKSFGPNSLPFFPPKKLLPLTAVQTEERRNHLEKYIQIVSQDHKIINSELFNGFLLNAQQESQNVKMEEVTIDVYQMNWQTISVKVLSNDRTDVVMDSVANVLNLPLQLVPYFCLYIITRDGNNITLVRKLQNFESPYLSLKIVNSTNNHHYLVIRRCFWDSVFDDDCVDDRAALNILYSHALNDIERGLLPTNKEIRRQLTALQAKGSKKEYLQLARTLKYYGYIQFEPCFCDYPTQGTRVQISAGGKEFNMRAHMTADQIKEFSFRVTRIRCWRLTTSNDKLNGSTSSTSETNTSNTRYELSFEYLISKDNLQWVNVVSEQAILMSVCLQGMVEELLMKRNGRKFKRDDCVDGGNRRGSWSYMKRDGSSQQIAMPRSISTEAGLMNGENSFGGKRNLKSSHSHNDMTKNRSTMENDAFDGIGDDDL